MFFRKVSQAASKIPAVTRQFIKANETGAICGATFGLGVGVLSAPGVFYFHATRSESETYTGIYLDGMKGVAENTLLLTVGCAAVGSPGVSIPLALAYEAYHRGTNNEPSSIKPK